MFVRGLRMLVKITLGLLAFFLLALLAARALVGWHARARCYAVLEAPAERVAIVFGAGLLRDGSPTAVLRDRVAAAAALFSLGRVEKILMSGDNRFESYNEPAAMRAYALDLGIPESAIVLDYAGRRTYDTCYRAREIFGLKRALLVTQAFHLPRALYTCNALGVESAGVIADQRAYRRSSVLFWQAREFLASAAALWEVHITHPLPVLGEREPIFWEEP